MDISQQLSAVAKALHCNFTLQSQKMPYERVFAVDGLLPAIMRRADQLSSFCLGEGLGVKFEDSNESLLGVKVLFEDGVSSSLRLMCALDVMIELMQNAPSRYETPIDELMYD